MQAVDFCNFYVRVRYLDWKFRLHWGRLAFFHIGYVFQVHFPHAVVIFRIPEWSIYIFIHGCCLHPCICHRVNQHLKTWFWQLLFLNLSAKTCCQCSACAVSRNRNMRCVDSENHGMFTYPFIHRQHILRRSRIRIFREPVVIWKYNFAICLTCINTRQLFMIRRSLIPKSTAVDIKKTWLFSGILRRFVHFYRKFQIVITLYFICGYE